MFVASHRSQPLDFLHFARGPSLSKWTSSFRDGYWNSISLFCVEGRTMNILLSKINCDCVERNKRYAIMTMLFSFNRNRVACTYINTLNCESWTRERIKKMRAQIPVNVNGERIKRCKNDLNMKAAKQRIIFVVLRSQITAAANSIE